MLRGAVKSIQIIQSRQDLITCESARAQSLQQPDLLDRVAKVVVAGRGHHLNGARVKRGIYPATSGHVVRSGFKAVNPYSVVDFGNSSFLLFYAKPMNTLLTKDRLKFGLMTTSTSPPSTQLEL